MNGHQEWLEKVLALAVSNGQDQGFLFWKLLFLCSKGNLGWPRMLYD